MPGLLNRLHHILPLILSDEEEDILLIVAILFLGADMASQLRHTRRATTRLYLTRPQLLPNPRYGTPWQMILASQNDRAFITTMGLDCNTFEHILHSGFADIWDTTPIPRADTSSIGEPRLGARSLDAAGALGLALHYLASCMPSTSLQEIFAIIPTTVSRYIDFTLSILLQVLRRLPEAEIRWPTEEEMWEFTDLIAARHSLLVGAFASIDGVRLPSTTSSDPEIENATYNGWTHTHGVNSVLVFSPRGAYNPAFFPCHITNPYRAHHQA